MLKMVNGALVEMTEAEIAQAALDAEMTGVTPRRIVPLAAVLARLKVLGAETALLDVLESFPEVREQLLVLEEGIYADDADARAIFAAAGADPDVVLG